MTTPIAPVMDNCFMDVCAFFVPTRLLSEHWEEFWGENKETYWEQPIKYKTPKLEFYDLDKDGNEQSVKAGSLINYLGIPVGYKEDSGYQPCIAYPLRAYCKIFNDWWRDENVKQPIIELVGDETTTVYMSDPVYNEETSYIDIAHGQYCAKAAKIHDYFTSCLPAPLKANEVSLFGSNGLFPVNALQWSQFDTVSEEYTLNPYETPNRMNIRNIDQWTTLEIGPLYMGDKENAISPHDYGYPTNKHVLVSDNGEIARQTGNWTNDSAKDITPTNLWADLSNAAVSTISQLRTAFAIQRFYEAQARGGTRYCEFLANIFSVTNPDSRLQRSEFLGSRRFPINVDQVLQTSGTGASGTTTPQGNTAAYSCTVNSDDLFTYSATEHGIVMVLATIRQEHSYSQGISREWFRDSWEDYYVPQFAHLSEQAVLERELYATGEEDKDKEVFGYQECWAEYRYKPSMITGKLSPQASGSLDIWHYGDYYTEKPTLSAEWINETPNNIARTLAVQNEPQFIIDAYFPMKWTRVMPLYGVPGLLDHF